MPAHSASKTRVNALSSRASTSQFASRFKDVDGRAFATPKWLRPRRRVYPAALARHKETAGYLHPARSGVNDGHPALLCGHRLQARFSLPSTFLRLFSFPFRSPVGFAARQTPAASPPPSIRAPRQRGAPHAVCALRSAPTRLTGQPIYKNGGLSAHPHPGRERSPVRPKLLWLTVS